MMETDIVFRHHHFDLQDRLEQDRPAFLQRPAQIGASAAAMVLNADAAEITSRLLRHDRSYFGVG
jgi:hypothetical protein